MPILLNAQGRPEPSPEVTRRLLEVHAGLFLRFFDQTGANWAICWAWPKSDPRWEAVQTGAADPAAAFDIVGWLPMDCAVEEAPAYLERSLRSYPKEEVARLAERVTHFNMAGGATQALVEEAIGEVLDGADPTGKTKTRRGKRVQVEKIV